MNNLPDAQELTAIIKALQSEIEDDFRAFETDDEDSEPGIQLTIGWDYETGLWAAQSGDNSFMGPAYHFHDWAVTGVYRDSDVADIVEDIHSQLIELAPEDWEK